MAVLIQDTTDHFRKRIKEHIVSKGCWPVGNRETGIGAGDQAADEDQYESGYGGKYGTASRVFFRTVRKLCASSLEP